MSAGLRGSAPPDLPRLVMRRAGAVAALVLAVALVLGLVRADQDVADELDAAVALAEVLGGLGALTQADDAAALAGLRALQARRAPRHLLLQVFGADGRVLLAPPPPPALPLPVQALLDLHRRWGTVADGRTVHWTLPRPDGGHWTVALQASPAAEQREAMVNLAGTLALLLLCIAGLLLAMRWNLKRAFVPLGRLLQAIGRIGHVGAADPGADAIQALPTMPTRELETLAAALRQLGAALHEAEDRRRVLAQQVLTLQEDERARLARELHDELGQHLTALRVDAAWLARRVADQPAQAEVVAGMGRTCQQLQQDVRGLLARLQPFGPASRDGEAGQALARLQALLEGLVQAWTPTTADGPPRAGRPQLHCQALDAAGHAQPWPDAALAAVLRLPEPVALALYRIVQEALTNVARHAQAREVRVTLTLQGTLAPGAALRCNCAVEDDGVGLPTAPAGAQRGNGLGGIRERVWALGGELQLTAADGAGGRGLRLQARFDTAWLAAAAAMGGEGGTA